MVPKNLMNLIAQLEKRNTEIPDKRRLLLTTFADYITVKAGAGIEIKLNFICTHNSRRSHMSQIWAQTAAEYFSIPSTKCFSGGTEATTFNIRAVKTVRDFGFKVEQKNESGNPNYLVHYSNNKEPLKCFSKVYNDKFNPQKEYAAIMTCSTADKNCPIVFGAEKRFPITYDDPKGFDSTELEKAKYAERFEQIGIEMIFTFGKVKI